MASADALRKSYRTKPRTKSVSNTLKLAPKAAKRVDNTVADILQGAANASAISRPQPVEPQAPETEKDMWGKIGDGLGDFLETPAIKTALDILSVGTYASANTVDNVLDAGSNLAKGNMRGITDLAMAGVTGVGQGLSAAAGNEADAQTYGKIMNERLGEVSEGDTAGKWTRGIAGFVGDVALDPLTYVTLGGAAAVKAGARGAKEASVALKAASKYGPDVAATPIKYENARKAFAGEFKGARADQKVAKKDAKEWRKYKRQTRRMDSGERAEWARENIPGLRPAVQTAVKADTDLIDDIIASGKIKDEDVAVAADAPRIVEDTIVNIDRRTPDAMPIVDAPMPKMPDEVIAPTAAKAANPNRVTEPEFMTAPNANLSDIKPVTDEENLVETLSNIRVNKEVAAAPKAVATDFDVPAFSAFVTKVSPRADVMMRNGKQLKWGQIKRDFNAADPATQKRIINAIDPAMTEKFRAEASADDVLASIQNVTKSVGDIRSITKEMRAGNVPLDSFAGLAAAKGIDPTDNKAIAQLIDGIAKTPQFKESVGKMQRYNTGARLGITDPEKGISGTAVSAIPSERYSAADIIAAKTPATPEQSKAYLESRYTQVATDLANHRMGKELRLLADSVFLDAVGIQKLPAGPLRTRRGASTKGKGQGAKFEQLWNTHANIKPIDNIVTEARKLAGRDDYLKDSIIMTTLRDVDARLRLAGIDSHLSNMALSTDKTVIRLSPSEVFELMPRAARMKYLWGRGPRGAINEVMPSTVMDLAETLVRSITRLNPDGTPDFANASILAMAALQGRYPVEAGTRLIRQNLDQQTMIKSWEAIIRKVDPEAAPKLIAQMRAVDQFPDKSNFIDSMAAHYNKADGSWDKASKARIDSTVVGLLELFVKGFSKGQPSILSDLVATNMKNAAVFGGHVGSRVEAVAKEHFDRITEALTTGTAGDFLSELVVKPPYPHKSSADKAVDAARNDAQKVVQSAVANVAEVKHHTAAAKNVAANTPGKELVKYDPKVAAKNNAEAFQPHPDGEAIMAKAPKDVTPQDIEDYLDITQREMNIDVIYRMYGTQRYFNARAGMHHSFETVTGSAHAASHLMTGFHNIMRNWASQGISKEQLRVSFKALQNPERNIQGLDNVTQDMLRMLNTMFDPSKNNFLTRNSVGPAHFNSVLEGLKFTDEVRVPVDATPAEINQIWSTWNVNDPMDFFSKMMRAMTKTAEDISMGASFSSKFGSKTKLPGYRKPIDRSGKSPFMPLIDQDLYYPVELIDEIPMIGRMMTESRSFDPGSKLHTFVTKVMDPIVSMLKLTQTTMKPGHHVMSLTGDMWRNSLAGMGSSTKEYAQIARILHTNIGSIKEFDDIEKWANVKNAIHNTELGKNTNQRFETIRLGNKRVKIGHEDLYRIMEQRGVVLPAHLGGIDVDEMADFDQLGTVGNKFIDGIGKTTAAVDRLANPKHGKYSINAFTAHRDSFGRGALFINQMQSKSFGSIEEAADYAAGIVRKWAPTSADLGAFEAKYARRVFFYYTWLRGMLPRIIEGALTKPGVAMVPSKLMFNTALANGVDPSTIGDPFPEGTLFPKWYQDRVLGPQWSSPDSKGGDDDLWGMNPTGPLMDVANSVGSGVRPSDLANPGQLGAKLGGTLMGMSTPWAKVPAELTMGRTLTGAPIEDKSQYLQDMIGPLRVASRASGKDLSSPFMGDNGPELANRTGSKYREGLEGDGFNNAFHELLNWASGAQVTNYTSDQSENSVKFAERDKLSQERKLAERFGG